MTPGPWPAARLARMSLPLRIRRPICAWVVGALLGAQWLVSAYACPAPPPGATAAVQAQAAAPDCHDAAAPGLDVMAAGLCQAHCSSDEQLPAPSPALDLPPASPGWCMVAPAAPAPQEVGTRTSLPPLAWAGAPPGWPPIYLIHGALRN